MNILIASWRGPGHPLAGGAETSAHEHAKAWARKGHKVTLFTSFFHSAQKKEVIDGISVIRYGDEVLGVRIAFIIWYLLGIHEKFDLVVDEFHGLPFFTPLFVRTIKLAFIHEVAKEVWWTNPWPKPFNLIPGFFGSLFESLIYKILYRNTPFMTVSDSTKSDLVEWGIPQKNIHVIHNGVTVIEIKNSVKKETKKTLLYLGALTKDKGIEDAIKVFSLINETDPDWQFWIIGKGEEKYVKYVKQKILELGMQSKVRYWGYVSEEKKFELLARAHLLINPSIREGWGLVNIEANRVYTPVVAWNVAGCKDSVKNGETGLLITKGDYRLMCNSIINLTNNRTNYNKMVKNARIWSKNFTWEKSVKESLVLIENKIK